MDVTLELNDTTKTYNDVNTVRTDSMGVEVWMNTSPPPSPDTDAEWYAHPNAKIVEVKDT